MSRIGHPRLAAGLNLSRSCGGFFWFGYLAWLTAIFAGLYCELELRLHGEAGFYLVEGFIAMLAVPFALYGADQLVLNSYQHTSRLLDRKQQARLLLDELRMEDLRREVVRIPLLRLFVPARSRDLAGQLLTGTLWFSALQHPAGTSSSVRYREQLREIALGVAPPCVGACLFFAAPTRSTMLIALLLTALGLAMLGYSAVVFAARRQAVLDFFTSRNAGQVHC